MDCPFLNSDYPECSRYLNLQHLEEAFRVCTDLYMLCPVYVELTMASLAPEAAATACHSDSF